MSTPLTDSINALTTYANGVTGASDINLSDAVHTLASGYGGGGSVKTGTFVGDGTKEVNLSVGFEPDVIVIDSGLDPSQSGYTGLIVVAIAKNVFTVNNTHNSDTDTQNARTIYGSLLNKGWGDNKVGAYRNVATYANGVLKVTNATNSPSAQYCFINAQTYTWVAYKA